jgi:hypothetical protein
LKRNATTHRHLALYCPITGEIKKHLPQRFIPSDATKIPDLIDAYNRAATERKGVFTLMMLVEEEEAKT